MEEDIAFHKLEKFLEDILILHGISKNLAPLLYEMMSYVNQQEQLIVNSFLKNQLAEKMKTSRGTIDNVISRLKDVGILLRMGRGTYKFHDVFQNIDRLLEDDRISIKIIYQAEKRKISRD